MRDARTFPRGGVHPHDFKSLTNAVPIRNAPIPAEAVIPMQQHMGAAAQCLVGPGDTVKEGMLIGRAAGPISANVHSPIPGKVKQIVEVYLPGGARSKCAEVALEGEFELSGHRTEGRTWAELTAQELLDKIAEQGIVGMGGAAFPTHVKYRVREAGRVEFFVVNGVECEPYLTADHRLMLEKTEEIFTAIAIAARILEPEAILIGIEENKLDAVEAMQRTAAARGLDYQVSGLELKYPQGDEKQLLKALTGREVPSGGLPLDIGAVVSNVGTLFAIYEAVVLDKPLIERIVTVSGTIVRNPANFKVRLGTRIGELFDECGGFTEPPGRVIAGGPMMGFALADLDAPVTKGISGVIALSRSEIPKGRETPCISCGRCIVACPWGLSPTELYKWIDHQEYGQAMTEGLMDCKECGCCGYVCPARIPLVQGMKLGKLMGRTRKL